MRKFFTLALLGLLTASPSRVAAQLGVGARIGTLGIGGEAALELSDRFVFRGGAGLSKLTASTTFDGVPVVLELPEAWYNLGVDFYLNSALRLGAGVAYKPDDPSIRGDFTGAVDIGGVTLTPAEIGTLTGTIDSDDQAAYVLLGFGKHTDSGIGLFIDVGTVILGSPTVDLQATGGTYPQDELDLLLREEARAFENDMKTYLRFWPIMSLGLRIGIGY